MRRLVLKSYLAGTVKRFLHFFIQKLKFCVLYVLTIHCDIAGPPVKFIYSERVTKNFKISAVDLTGAAEDKSTVEISHKFVAFSEYIP